MLVVGGGDSALEEATYLTKFASDVVLVHRRDELRGSKIMQDYARAKPNLSVLTPYVVEEVLGADVGRVTGARLRNPRPARSASRRRRASSWRSGTTPNTELFRGILDMDENGYLIVEPGTTRTNIDGVFAAGDVADHVYRQAITAAGIRLHGGARRRALADARRARYGVKARARSGTAACRGNLQRWRTSSAPTAACARWTPTGATA